MGVTGGWELHVPQDFIELDDRQPFMSFSNCQALDFLHPEYKQICGALRRRQHFHRKAWEWIFIIHHLQREGVLKVGSRGLGFGVGSEPLTAYFVSRGASIVATDAPPEVTAGSGWAATGEYSASISGLRHDDICPYDLILAQAQYRHCDMNHIGDDLGGFDFNWSSCCFEHLGDLEAGMKFVVESTERTLRPGGVGVHTTELNLSSNTDTIESGGTVLYRRRDLERLIARLEERGHTVRPLRISPGGHPLDQHVDVPPYTHDPHLKLRLMGYTATSVGLVVIRG